MDDDYTDKELRTFTKADLIEIIMEQEQKIIDLTPDARQHGSHPEKELKALRHARLMAMVKSKQKTIAAIIASPEATKEAPKLAAYGKKGLTATEVAQLQFEKSM